MLPRRTKRVVLRSSEVEEYKKKARFGHWVLVRRSVEDLRKERDDDGSTERVVYPREKRSTDIVRFVADNVAGPTAEGCLDVSGRHFRHADDAGFSDDRRFDLVSTVNADDNLLRLASFRTFKSVLRLSLRRNVLESVDPSMENGHLSATLIRLDVSENRLKPEDLYRLSWWNLKQLYASANALTAVPDSITHDRCFLSLELLDLSENHISCAKTFYLLSSLHNLRQLNLSDNRISFVPYLKRKRADEEEHDKDANDKDTNDKDNELEYRVQHNPFVSLTAIDLSNNLIDQCSSVLSMICWSSLAKVVLTANTVSLKKNLSMFKRLKSTFSEYNIKIVRE